MFLESRFTIIKYGMRFWALYDGDDLICVTAYRKGALEVKRRLERLMALLPQQAAA